MTSRWKLRLLLPALIPAALGCSHFGSHEDIFAPIPPDVGKREIAGTDTAWVERTTAYTAIARDRTRLADVKEDLERALQLFEYETGLLPRPVTLVIGSGPDSLPSVAFADTSARPVLRVFRTEDRGRRRGMFAPRGALPPGLVGTWLGELADSIPPWLMAGISGTVSSAAFSGAGPSRLRDRKDDLLPLDSLFYAPPTAFPAWTPGERPVGARGEPPRDRGRVARPALLQMEASAVLDFLSEQAGHRVTPELLRTLRPGTNPEPALAGAGVRPPDIMSLKDLWQDWLRRR